MARMQSLLETVTWTHWFRQYMLPCHTNSQVKHGAIVILAHVSPGAKTKNVIPTHLGRKKSLLVFRENWN